VDRIDWKKLDEFERNNAERICRHFFPSGKKNGLEWKLGDVGGAPGDSLGVQLAGERAALWCDRATNEGGRLRKLIAMNRALSDQDAVDEIERAFGVTFRENGDRNGVFDWSVYKQLTESDCQRLCTWRGYSAEFVAWLVQQDLIRVSNGKYWAFPIHREGKIVGAHSRPIEWNGEGRVPWSVYPKSENGGPGMLPLILGQPDQSETAHAFESTWDALGICDKLKIYETEGVCAVATRGSKNTKFGNVIPKNVRRVCLWEQNDEPGRIWAEQIVRYLPHGASVLVVPTPKVHADVNDWIRVGASASDLLEAITAAKVVEPREPGKETSADVKGADKKTIERGVGFYDVSKKEYLIRNESGRWLSLTDAQFKLRLRNRGISTRKPDHGLVSAGEQVMLQIQDYSDVQYSGALAGRKSGFYEENGVRLLVTSDPKLIAAVKGEWPTLRAFITNLLGGRNEPWADRQLSTLFGWLKIAIHALRLGQFQPGQALTFAGPVNCGKSLLQSIITEILAGRSAKAALFLQGRTDFNSELFGAEHLVLEDEAASTSHQARAMLGSQIKAITVNRVHPCHGKRRDIVNLCPWWRLSISCNDRPDKLLILPPLSDDISDKIILLRSSSSAMPMPTETSAEKEAFWEVLKSELPAFLWWLENSFAIPKALESSRFGIIDFHHPELLAALDELSPSHALEELIDQAKVWGAVDDFWEGTALELRSALLNDERTRRDAEHLLNWTNAAGQYLGDLQKKSPDRYQSRKTSTKIIWIIYARNHSSSEPLNH
jgi:hypothetical protein